MAPAPRARPGAGAPASESWRLGGRFLLGGAFNAATCVVFSQVGYLLLDRPTVAFVLGYAASLTLSYFVNALVVFRAPGLSPRGFAGFVLAYVPNFAIQFGVVAAMIHWFGVDPLVAYVLGVAVAVPVTFLILSKVTFRSRHHAPDLPSRETST